jgi:hypothetical protein
MNCEEFYLSHKENWHIYSEMILLPEGKLEYKEFIEKKKQKESNNGFKPSDIPEFLFDFQKELVEWSLIKGKSAIFADCGLGKTPMQLVWADNVVKHTNKPVLILTPLAVSFQTQKEGEKFGIEVFKSKEIKKGINITNYEQLHHFNPSDFSGVVCDESSILKNYSGQTKKEITRFMNKMDYRLLCTATAAPNDFIELGTSSEALGVLPHMEMLSIFFRNTENDKNPQWSTPKWELKKHGIDNFWRWVCTWGKSLRKPSDLGYEDGNFQLPPLNINEIIVENTQPLQGRLFVQKAKTMNEQREERKTTLKERCEMVVEKCNNHEYSVVWCHLNMESDLLEKILPDSVNVQGSDKTEYKEEMMLAFSAGQIKRLIIKPKIGGFGMNWQHCNHMTYFPSHSYEQYYQGVRRCWRFGQINPVDVDVITTEGEMGVYKNLERKSKQADEMFNKIVKFMNNGLNYERNIHITNNIEVPKWI